jgi:hypothetical protein
VEERIAKPVRHWNLRDALCDDVIREVARNRSTQLRLKYTHEGVGLGFGGLPVACSPRLEGAWGGSPAGGGGSRDGDGDPGGGGAWPDGLAAVGPPEADGVRWRRGRWADGRRPEMAMGARNPKPNDFLLY